MCEVGETQPVLVTNLLPLKLQHVYQGVACLHSYVTDCLRLRASAIWSGSLKSPGFLPAFLGRNYDILQSKHCGRSSSHAECNDGCRLSFRVVEEMVVQHGRRKLPATTKATSKPVLEKILKSLEWTPSVVPVIPPAQTWNRGVQSTVCWIPSFSIRIVPRLALNKDGAAVPAGRLVNSNHILCAVDAVQSPAALSGMSDRVYGGPFRPGTCSLPAATDLTSQLTEASQVLKQDTSKLEEAKKAQNSGQIQSGLLFLLVPKPLTSRMHPCTQIPHSSKQQFRGQKGKATRLD